MKLKKMLFGVFFRGIVFKNGCPLFSEKFQVLFEFVQDCFVGIPQQFPLEFLLLFLY